VPILHQGVAVIDELRFLARPLAHQPRLGIGGRGMGGVGSPLAVEVDGGIPGVIRRGRPRPLLLEALQPGPGLDQRPVDREVLRRQELAPLSLGQHPLEEGPGDIPAEQPLPVLGEHGRVPDPVINAEAHEPPEEEVVVQLLHELAFAPDRVQHLQQQGPEQLLGRDRRTPGLRVQPRELGRELPERRVDHRADRPQGVVRRNPLLGGHVTEHRVRTSIVAAHAPLLVALESGMHGRSLPRFSASC
jgi:hypothetical protein